MYMNNYEFILTKRVKINKKRNNSLSHKFAGTSKLGWRNLHFKMNEIDKSKNNSSIMTTRQEFIVAMEKLAKNIMIQFLGIEYPSKEQIRKLATSEDFNEMVYEALLYKEEKKDK